MPIRSSATAYAGHCSTLPDEQRTALALAYYGGKTQTEIAAELQQPLGTIKSRMKLGLRKLAAALETLSWSITNRRSGLRLYALGALERRSSVRRSRRTCAGARVVRRWPELPNATLRWWRRWKRDTPAPPELAGRVVRALAANVARPASLWQRPAWLTGALAAALLVGLLPSMYFWRENRALHRAMVAQSEAMERVAAGPHLTAAFRSAPGSPPASVTYAPDGSWYLIVVHDASKALGVAWMHEGRHTMLGRTVSRGSVAMLYLPKSHRMDRLALMDGPRIVAQADLCVAKNASKSSRCAIRVAGGSAERIVAP